MAFDQQELSDEQHHQAVRNEYNFDSPDAFDTDCIVYTLRRLKEGKSVEIPVYNFTTHRVEKKKVSCCFISVWFTCPIMVIYPSTNEAW